MSQCDSEFSTREIRIRVRARSISQLDEDCDLQSYYLRAAPRGPRKQSAILLQSETYDTINFAAATQREVNVANEVLVQWSVDLCSLAPIAAMSSVSSSPFRAKAVCRKWTYLRAMIAKKSFFETACPRRPLPFAN